MHTQIRFFNINVKLRKNEKRVSFLNYIIYMIIFLMRFDFEQWLNMAQVCLAILLLLYVCYVGIINPTQLILCF